MANLPFLKIVKSKKFLLRLVPIIIVLLAIIGALIWMFLELRPVPSQPDHKISIDVHKGDTFRQVTIELQKKGLIRNAFASRIYMMLVKHHLIVEAGHYAFPPGTSLSDILYSMEHGQTVSEVVKVTFPEGFTVRQMANRLAQSGICSASAFMNAVQTGHYTESFLKQLPNNPLIKTRLEGYLFPDTYDFLKGENPHEIVNEMLEEFSIQVTAQMFAQMHQEHLTLNHVITEASLIEREDYVPAEKPIIASVINNRLKRGMKLQIDSTIEYILGHHTILTDADTRVKNPYNTYLYYGLPPGPIANPGIASIEAVLHPAHTDYFYYVARYDGTGRHFFARTYAQQLKNEQISRENYKKLEESSKSS